jgi:predicted transcriptional regulator
MHNKRKLVLRKGRPFTLYLSPEQARELDTIARSRRVAKAELMRVALDRLLLDMRNGQLSLPLGLEGL